MSKFTYTGPLTTHGDQVLFPGNVVDLSDGPYLEDLKGMGWLQPVADPPPAPDPKPKSKPEKGGDA